MAQQLIPTKSDPQAAQAPRVAIDIRDAAGAPSRVVVHGSRAIIGRAADAQVRLDRPTVSRQHAELLCDPFGRWWIRDLGSRNGVLFGGRRVTERPLRSGDVVQVGEFSLGFDLASSLRDSVSLAPRPQEAATLYGGGANSATDIIVGDTGPSPINTARELPAPKISASHLSALMETGRLLMQADDPQERAELLCKLMVRDDFKGSCAMALRMQGEKHEIPHPLCPPQMSAGTREAPHVSRNLLRFVRQQCSPAMASNSVGGPNMLELSISMAIDPVCAVAVPLTGQAGVAVAPDASFDLLYVTFPPMYGTGEWLAIAALAAEHYRLAELAWAARQDALAHAAVERELEQARDIQFRLVPRDLVVPGLQTSIGFHPCRWVGGDYVDIAYGPDGRVLLAVADVCGKGLAAALVASSIHTLVHAALRRKTGSLCEIMSGLNDYLCEHLPAGNFATMSAILLDPNTGELELANSGHPPPLIVSPGGEVTPIQGEPNYPLGVEPGDVVCRTAKLEPGQMLAMFTDGLTETRVNENDLLGIERLGEEIGRLVKAKPAAPVSDVAERLKGVLDRYLGNRLPDDDRTYLLARRG